MTTAVIVAIVAVLVALYYRSARNIAMDKRLYLTSYVVYLLLSDETRASQKRKLLTFIGTQEGDPLELGNVTFGALERLAEGLAVNGNSVLAATAMIAEAKRSAAAV